MKFLKWLFGRIEQKINWNKLTKQVIPVRIEEKAK